MTDLHAIPPGPDNNPASPSPGPPWSDRYKLILLCCIPYAIPANLGLLMVIYLAIPALMTPEIGLDPGSSVSSLTISTSLITAQWNVALSIKNPSMLIPVKYTRMKLRLSIDGQLALSRPSLIPTFTQGPGNVTTVRTKALSMVAIVNDWGVKGLVSMLNGLEVTIDVVAKAKRRLHLDPWWLPVFDVYFSCMGVAFTAPTDSEGGNRDWMILGGTLSCTPDIFTQVWNRIKPSWTNWFNIRGAIEEAGFVLLEDHLWIGHDSRPSEMASVISLISYRNSLRLTLPLPSQSTQSNMELSRWVISYGVVATSTLKWDS